VAQLSTLGCYTFMKNTCTLILSGLLLCSCCTQKQASQPAPAIDRVQSKTDTAWDQGVYVLHVTKRQGNSLEGIQIIMVASDGVRTIVSADTGTIALRPSCLDSVKDDNSVAITLKNPETVTSDKHTKSIEIMRVLHR
jgi:hypothetical protein